MNFLQRISKYISDKSEAIRQDQLSTIKYFILQHSISCRCGGTAVPVFDSNNKYYCIKCNNRFANARHQLYESLQDISFLRDYHRNFKSSVAREKYNEVIQILEKEII
ncbi:hypothetical protein [Acinetobacter haemolyticus]|uniref:Uncharacterized protein n=1 Tax=Acinetobacter haemolyticus TaxID=29430 RepID=A0A4P7B6G0_ACIHA|nr:hypothetical protein [Acinetobacter haemolyticus]QBQ16628.1 hypothetical protein AHTJR_10200 [Acinetobacter haemolyticus]